MLKELQEINLFPVTTGFGIILNIVIAFICGYIISWIYRRTYRGSGYSVAFINSIVLLAMITSIVIMIIGNNLARAFGLVGAMSIIRFRTAVKNTQDIIYLFFSLSMGMAAGVGLYGIAFTGTFFIGVVIYAFYKSPLSLPGRDEYLLQFNFLPGKDKNPPYQTILDKYCRKQQIINVRSVDEKGLLELSYYIKLKDINKGQELVQYLRDVTGVQYVNLFFDEEHL